MPAGRRYVTTDLRHVTTDRLELRAVVPDDLETLHVLHADPRVWEHAPWGRHTSRERTQADVAEYAADWARDGLGYWTARLRRGDSGAGDVGAGAGSISAGAGDAGAGTGGVSAEAGAFVGIGGVRLRPTSVFNVYYRLSPDRQGHGYAVEIARAGLTAAARFHPDVPVTAYLLEHNLASRRTAERLGLELVWRGPDAGNPDPAAVRLIYADRPLDRDVVERLVAQ